MTTLHYSEIVGVALYGERCAASVRIYSALYDRPHLTIALDTGAASVQFYLSPAEARAMAQAMLAAADRTEEVARGFQPGARKAQEVAT